MNNSARILVFDSGVGGLTVVRALRLKEGDVQIAYAADNAAFPYGNWQESKLIERMTDVMAVLIERLEPDVVVIACNTASTVGLEALRQTFDVPFVGTVPAIKPAANNTKSGLISVLATPGTVRREYTKALIDTYAYHCKVALHGAEKLAHMAEEKLAGRKVDLDTLKKEIAPVFVRVGGKRTDGVVLGCTHYPLLVEEMEQVAPWPVNFIDPAPAIARQALKIVAGNTGRIDVENLREFDGIVVLTGKNPSTALDHAVFENLGFRRLEYWPIDV